MRTSMGSQLVECSRYDYTEEHNVCHKCGGDGSNLLVYATVDQGYTCEGCVDRALCNENIDLGVYEY